ncbi:uncharacterized protein LOC120710522 [Panicum virgatum]|uniref:DUF7731 domain-containing protein n=1 Tax=Panicum virgatum TaxID=38727 RepID=A0A8T0SJI9_PANVG|nr:uncharacterized protein LOC120710522 [Panicum virgatum]KAG2596469.1 hypothetical protein PVAP13_5KG164100 [Panicum virgatum]
MRALLCNPALHYLFRSSEDQSTLFCSPCFFFFFFFLLARRRHTIPPPLARRPELACQEPLPPMAASAPSRALRCFLLACISCCLLVPCCTSDGSVAAAAAFHGQERDAPEIVGRALVCFDDRYIYSGCQGSFRLGPQGALDVPPGSADAFCGGPCVAETELVLRCVDGIMGNFRFYNGATAADVRSALDRGCGRSGLRGDFDVLRRLGGRRPRRQLRRRVLLRPRGPPRSSAAASRRRRCCWARPPRSSRGRDRSHRRGTCLGASYSIGSSIYSVETV